MHVRVRRGCLVEIYDQHGELVATGAGTFRYLKGKRTDGSLTFLDREAAD